MAKRTICLQNAARLSLKNNNLHISTNLGKHTIPLEDIWVLILESHEIVVSTALLDALSREGIGVIVCDRSHMPSALQLPLGAHSRHAAIVEDQLLISKPLAKQLWRAIVIAKITNQAFCLEVLGIDGAGSLRELAKHVTSGDSTNRESVAAAQFFKKYITKGTRREGPYAALLDYGYAIVRAGVARSAVSGGWLVSRGIHHSSDLNAFNLVDDLLEPFRPIVDMLVYSCDIEQGLSSENKRRLVRIFECEVNVGGKKHSVQSAIEAEIDSLKRAVKEKDASKLQLPTLLPLNYVSLEVR